MMSKGQNRSRSRDERRKYTADRHEGERHRDDRYKGERYEHDNIPRARTPPLAREASSEEDDEDSEHDDTTAHYKGGPGDMITSRYKILSDAGLGTFGRVIRCEDLRTGMEVCIKVIRSIPKYAKSARLECDILNKIKSRDTRNTSLCVLLLDQFAFEGHECLVFETLGTSLYDLTKLNEYAGFPYSYVVACARQLVQALAFLHGMNLIHTDLKLENILSVTERLEHVTFTRSHMERHVQCPADHRIKVIDFGGAVFDDEDKSSEVNTRQYRCPEVVLGQPWSFPSDMWGLGCILMELYTGELLFGTHDNLEHLALMERIVGPFPRRVVDAIPRSHKAYDYFDSRRAVRVRDLRTKSHRYVSKQLQLRDLVAREHSLLLDLVRGCLELDPARRITATQALEHPLFREDHRRPRRP